MRKIRVSAPGKVHLMGEHAVVYGKPALLAAINLRLSVTVEELGKNNSTGELITVVSAESTDHARYAVGFLLKELKIEGQTPIKVTIDSQIPAGYHLGSSAALAVGLTGGVMYFFKNIWNPIRINELAYEIEKKQHGNPSGGDNTAVSMGGFIWFRKELEFLKSIWQLPFKPHDATNHFFLINTGRPKETTGQMVALVKENVAKNPEKMQKLLDLNEQQVKRVTVALKEGNENELIDAIRVGERTLEGMGVVSEKVKPLMRQIEGAGGAVKILGGGGVSAGTGFLLCYHRDPANIESISEKYKFPLQTMTLGGEGVRLDEK